MVFQDQNGAVVVRLSPWAANESIFEPTLRTDAGRYYEDTLKMPQGPYYPGQLRDWFTQG